MNMNEVEQWIAGGRHWDAGKELLFRLSGNEAVKRFFRTCNPTNENQDALLYELRKLKEVAKHAPVVESSIDKKAHDKAFPEIERLEKKWRMMYKDMAALNLKLIHFPTEAERRAAAFKILELNDSIREIWSKIKVLKERGALPKIKINTSLPNDPVELMKMRSNLRSNLSKAKRKLSDDGYAKKDSLLQRVEKWQQELNDIEVKLKLKEE